MMLLLDVYQNAIQECNKSISLVQCTNEFFSSGVKSNGVSYTPELHCCVIDGAFLSLFMTFEQFLENSFICYMMGQPGINGNFIVKYASPQNEEQAINMLKGTSRYADFTNRDTILKLAKNFFEDAGTYSYLNSISSDFEDMKKIRNAISHISIESKRAFDGLVRNKLGSLPPNISTSSFLNTPITGSASTFFIYYKDIIISAIDNISSPN